MIARCAGVFLMAGFIGVALGCDKRGSELVAPSPAVESGDAVVSPASAAGSVALCHRTEGGDRWVPISVALPAVDAHLRHGDGRVGYPVPGNPGMKFGADCVPVARVPVTITFAGLQVNGAPVSTYTESDFTVVSTLGNWEALTTYGHPAPYIIFKVFSPEPVTAAIRVTAAGGAPFSFASVDLYSSVTPIPYVFSGVLESNAVFSAAGTQPNTFGGFATVPNPHSTDIVDALSITLTNPALPFCVPAPGVVCNAMGLDNIVLIR